MSIRSIFIISRSCRFAGVWALDREEVVFAGFRVYAAGVISTQSVCLMLVHQGGFSTQWHRLSLSHACSGEPLPCPARGWGNPNTVKWGQRKTRRQTSGTMWLYPEPSKRQVGRVCWAEKRVTPRVTETHRQRRCRKRELQEERKQGRRGKGGKLVDGFPRTTLQLLCGSVLMTPHGQHLL